MYTRCPKCSTCFRVTDRHLAVAKGKVRCGQCQLVFNATEHAIDDLPLNSTSTKTSDKAPSLNTAPPAKAKVSKPITPPPSKKVAATKPDTTKDKVKKAAKPVAVKKAKKPPEKEVKIAPPLYKNERNISHGDSHEFDANFDLDAAINELTQATEESYRFEDKNEPSKDEIIPEKYIPTEGKSDDIFDTDAYSENNAESVADILNEMEGQLSLDIDEPKTNEIKDADNEFDFIELDNEIESAPEETQESNDEILKNHFDLKEFGFDENFDDVLDDELSEKNEFEDDKAENLKVDNDELLDEIDFDDFPDSEVDFNDSKTEDDSVSTPLSQDNTTENDIPFQLRGDIERFQAPTRRYFHPLIVFSFIIVLFVVSFLQLAYFRAHELVNLVPSSEPYIEAYCEKVDCHYSGPHDTKQIQLLSRDVRQHPKEKNALLISLAMINNAHFKQPYPNIHIRLSDISGNVVAERIFNTEMYMGTLSNPFLLMKSKTPVHINFEVVDPGVYPINFEFTFL